MDNHAKDKRGPAKYEIVAAVVLAVLAVGCFVLQALLLDAKTTQRETVLFNTLQFLLTVGFAWFSTRAISRLEFERSLKQFAIGAYRRITDIEAMVERLRKQLQQMHERLGDGEASHHLEVVGAVLEDTVQVVRSSTADWADVIGEELLAIDTIKSLRREKTELETSPQADYLPRALEERLREIDNRIVDLTANLPPNLQIKSLRENEEDRARRHQAEWMAWRHKEEDGLRLRVVAGGDYRCDGNIEAFNPTSELFAVLDTQPGIQVQDSAGVQLGRVLNNSPLDYESFRETLHDCYGGSRVSLRFVTQIDRQDVDGTPMCWYDVKVVARPIAAEKELHIGLSRQARHKRGTKQLGT